MIPRTLEPEVMDTVEEAVDYDSMDHSNVNRIFVEDLLSFLNSCPGDSTLETDVLDLGTGTALIPIELLQTDSRFKTVFACDLSLEMLKLARQHVENRTFDGTILPVYCDAKRLPMAPGSVSIVMSNSIVHHIPEPLDVFQEMRRVIKDDGVLFIRDLMRPESAEEVDHIVQTYAGNENAHQQKMFRESLHAALTVSEVESLLAASGFSKHWVSATSDRHWTIAGRC